MGLKIGEKTTYTAPNGRDITVEVVNVETFNG
jgi:transcription elongation factor GreA